MTHKEVRLIGPPGTGKTFTLASYVERTAEKYGAERLIAASFTRAAARVIASRVDLPRESVGTLHAHAYRALGRPTIAESKAAEWNEHVNDDPDLALDVDVARDADLDEPGWDERSSESATGTERLSRCNLLRAREVAPHLWPDDVQQFWSRWSAWKREASYLDFTDLIEHAADVCPTAPGDPVVLFVDEAQDMSPLEWRLARTWGDAAEVGLMAAADPAQAIYSFKGASPRSFFEPAIPQSDYHVLTQSFRVPRKVHERAVAWLRRSESDVLHEYLPRDYEGRCRRLPSAGGAAATWQSPDLMVELATEDARKTGRSHMILATCAYMLAPTVRRLRERGEPFHNPYRASAGAWNPLRGPADRLVDFLGPIRPDLFGKDGDQRLWTWVELSRWLGELRSQDTLKRGTKIELEARAKADGKLPERNRDPMTAGDLRRMMEPEAWKRLMADLQTDRPWTFLAERLLVSRQKIWRYALSVADAHGAAALLETPKVIVGTCHSTKGGEADVVWLMPDVSPSAHQRWIERGDGHDSIVRTFYVGMTRARDELVLTGAATHAAVDW